MSHNVNYVNLYKNKSINPKNQPQFNPPHSKTHQKPLPVPFFGLNGTDVISYARSRISDCHTDISAGKIYQKLSENFYPAAISDVPDFFLSP